MLHDLFISYAHQGDNTSHEAVTASAGMVSESLLGPHDYPGGNTLDR